MNLRAVPIAALSLLGGCRSITWSNDWVQTHSTGTEGELQLLVMSFNTEHRDRPDEMRAFAGWLRDVEELPDLILCQEVRFRPTGEPAAAVLATELDLHWRGTAREGDHEGLVVISRFPIFYYDELHLEARTSALLMGHRRVSTMAELDVPGLGRVRAVNVHFANWPFEGHVRRRQLEETLAWSAERDRTVPADVTILGGDFNMTPHAPEFDALQKAELTGGQRWLDGNTYRPTRCPRGRPVKRIDYLFIAVRGLDVVQVREKLLLEDGLPRPDGTGRFRLSDHLPLVQAFSMKPVGEPLLVRTMRPPSPGSQP